MAVSRSYTAVFMLLAAIFSVMIHPSHAHGHTTTTKRNPSLSSEHHFHSFLDHHHQDSQRRYQNHHHVIGSRFLFDSITTTSRHHARILQQDPDVICETYQNFTQAWDCSCQRFEVDGVRVNCSYIETQCNQDNSYCYDGYYDIVLNNQSQAQVVTSCINVVNAVSATAATDEPPQDICVRIFPTAPGDFSTIESCSATLNEEVCNFCSPCSPEDAAAAAAAASTNNNSNNQTSGSASNSTNNAAVTINCCNVQVDKIQTCGAVSAGGAMTPIFDVNDPSAQGKCKGTMSPPSSSSSSSILFATSIVVGLVLLLTTITMS